MLEQMAARYPNIVAIATSMTHDEGSVVGHGCDDQFEFEFALDLLLDGFERLHEQGWSSTAGEAGPHVGGRPAQGRPCRVGTSEEDMRTLQEASMTKLGKFEKYLIEEFFDDYRAGAMSQRTFTRRVAFITGSMAAASAAMLLVGCTPEEVPRSTDPMPTPSPSLGHGDRHRVPRPGRRGPRAPSLFPRALRVW